MTIGLIWQQCRSFIAMELLIVAKRVAPDCEKGPYSNGLVYILTKLEQDSPLLDRGYSEWRP